MRHVMESHYQIKVNYNILRYISVLQQFKQFKIKMFENQILPITELLRKLMCVRNDIECPLCHDKGIYEFVQAECMHHFCIRCFKKQQKEAKRKKSTVKQCPMCLLDFQKMEYSRPETISFSQLFKEIQVIGRGAFGEAIIVRSKVDPSKIFIAKKIRLKKTGEDGISQSQLLEADLLRQLSSDYVVQYTNQFTEKNQVIIVMEYCSLGDLKFQISQQKKLNQNYTEQQVMYWFCQLVLSLKDIHQEHIMHRDIKSENVFIQEGNIAKIGDFGISKVNKDGTLGKGGQVGTYEYMAPEIVEGLAYTYRADVWSLGVILYQLCALQVPFTAPNIFGLQVQIMDKDKEIEPIPDFYSQELKDLVKFILNKDDKKRPDITELQQNQYLTAQMEKFQESSLEAPNIHLKNDPKSKELREMLKIKVQSDGEGQEEKQEQKQNVDKSESDDFDDINDGRDYTKQLTLSKKNSQLRSKPESQEEFNRSRDDTKTNGQKTQFLQKSFGKIKQESASISSLYRMQKEESASDDFEDINDGRERSGTIGQKTSELKNVAKTNEQSAQIFKKSLGQPQTDEESDYDFDDINDGRERSETIGQKTNELKYDTKTNEQKAEIIKNSFSKPQSDEESDFDFDNINDGRENSQTIGNKTSEIKSDTKSQLLVRAPTQPKQATIDRTEFSDSNLDRELDSAQSPFKQQFGQTIQSSDLHQVCIPINLEKQINLGVGVTAEMVAEYDNDKTYKFDLSIIGSELKKTVMKSSQKMAAQEPHSHESKQFAITPAHGAPSPISAPLTQDSRENKTASVQVSEKQSIMRSDLNLDLSPLMNDQHEHNGKISRKSKIRKSRSRGESFSRGRSSKKMNLQEQQAQDLPPLKEDPEEHNNQTLVEQPEPLKLEDLQEFNVFKHDDYNLEKRLEQLEEKQNEEKKQREDKEEKEDKQGSEFEYDSEEWEKYLEASSEEAQNSEEYEDAELKKIQRKRAENEKKNNLVFQQQNQNLMNQQQSGQPYMRQNLLMELSMTDQEDNNQQNMHDRANFDYPTVPLILTYGNTHADIEIPDFIKDALERKNVRLRDHHRWMMFVYLDEGKKAMTHKVIENVSFKCIDERWQMKEMIDSPPFILSKTTVVAYIIKIKITFKSWTKLPPLRLSHHLNFDGMGMMGNKSFEIYVPKDSYVQNMVMDQYKGEAEVEEQISDKRKNKIHLKMGIESEEIYTYKPVQKTLSPRARKINKKNAASDQPPPEFTQEEIEKQQVKQWTVFVELDQMMGELIRVKDFIQKVKFSFERDHLEDNIIVTQPSSNLKRFEFTKTRPKSQFAITYIIHFQPDLHMKPHIFKIGKYTDEAEKTQMIKIPKPYFKKLMANIKMRKRAQLNTLDDDKQDVIALLNFKLDSKEEGEIEKEQIRHIVPSHIQKQYVSKRSNFKMKFEDYLASKNKEVVLKREYERLEEEKERAKWANDLDHFFYVHGSGERQKEYVHKSIKPELERDSARGQDEQKQSYFMYRQTKSGAFVKIPKQKKLDADFSYRSPLKKSQIQTIDIQVNFDQKDNEKGSIGSPRKYNNSQSPKSANRETINSQRSALSNYSMVKQPKVTVSNYLKSRQMKYRKKFRNNQQHQSTVIPVQDAKKMAENMLTPLQNNFQPSIATLSGRFNRFAKSAKKRNKNLSYCNSSMLSELKETEQSWAAVLNMVHGGAQSITNLKVENHLMIQKVPQSPRTSLNQEQKKPSWTEKRSVVMSTSNLDQSGIKSGQTVFKDKVRQPKIKLNGKLYSSDSKYSNHTTEKVTGSINRFKETFKTLDQESFIQKQRPKTGNTQSLVRNLNSAQKLKQQIELANRKDQSHIHQVMASTLQSQQVKEMTQNFVALNDMAEEKNDQFLQVPLSSRAQMPTTQNLFYNNSQRDLVNNLDRYHQMSSRKSVELSHKFDKFKNMSNRDSGKGEVAFHPTDNSDVFNDCLNSRHFTDAEQEAPQSSTMSPSQTDRVVIKNSQCSQTYIPIKVTTTTRKSIMDDDGLLNLQQSRNNASDIKRKMSHTDKIERAIKRHRIRQDRHGVSSKKVEPQGSLKPRLKHRTQTKQHCLRIDRFEQDQVQTLTSSFKTTKQKDTPINSTKDLSQTLHRNTLSKINETDMIYKQQDQSQDEEDTCVIQQGTGGSYLKEALMSPKLMKINAMSMNILNSQIQRDFDMVHDLRNKMQDQ